MFVYFNDPLRFCILHFQQNLYKRSTNRFQNTLSHTHTHSHIAFVKSEDQCHYQYLNFIHGLARMSMLVVYLGKLNFLQNILWQHSLMLCLQIELIVIKVHVLYYIDILPVAKLSWCKVGILKILIYCLL